MQEQPCLTTPGDATHSYFKGEHTVIYKVRLCRNYNSFFQKVWFLDRESNKWIRTFCYPPIDMMRQLRHG